MWYWSSNDSKSLTKAQHESRICLPTTALFNFFHRERAAQAAASLHDVATGRLYRFFFVFFFAKCPSRNQFCPTTMHGLHRTREREKKDATKKRNTAPKLYTLAKNVAIWGSLPQVTIFGNNSLRNLFRVYAVSQTNEAAVILLYVGQTDEIDRSNSVRKND